MNLFKSPLRRSGAAVAALFLGLTGAVALSTPASAHHPILDATDACLNADGSWVVNWKISNSERDLDADVKEIWTDREGTITGVGVGDIVKPGAPLTAVQNLPSGTENATIKVLLHWNRDGEDIAAPVDYTKIRPTKTCTPTPEPSESTPTPEPSESTPAPEPSESTPATPPSETPVEEPQFTYGSDCDIFQVGLEVPADWEETITIVFTPSTGKPQNLTVKPGDEGTVDFPASEGLTVKAALKGFPDDFITLDYEAPEDCDTSGGGAGSDEPTLPVTGANTGTIAGVAGGVLALGAVAFFVARRRKVNFTA